MSTATALLAPEIDRSSGLERLLRRRAIEAAIWGIPMVRFDAMRQAFFRDAQAAYGDISYWSKPADWKFQLVTPNSLASHVYFNFNTRMGPVVIDLPPVADACLTGSMVNAWESTLVEFGPSGMDKTRGGKYLVLPPGYKGIVPSRYIPIRSETHNGRALFIVTPESTADATSVTNMVRSIRVYSLMSAVNPPEQRFIDMSERLFDGAVRFDDTFFDSLARMVSEEPMRTRDLVAMSQIHALGIEKNRAFTPDREVREILQQSAEEVRAGLMKTATLAEPRSSSTQWVQSDAASLGPALTYESANRFGIDERNVRFFMMFEAPKKQRRLSPCFRAFRDAAGQLLQSGASYRLHIPAGISANQNWEVTACDLQTSCFVRESPRVAVHSACSTTEKNADGSVDVYFGSTRSRHQVNWIYTGSARPWFAVFRFPESEASALSHNGLLPDLEKIG